MGKTVSIILPFFNKWELTHSCLFNLYKFVQDNVTEVIVVNDASTELECYGGMSWWETVHSLMSIKFITNKENLGFGGSMNVGAKNSIGEILVFLSNDVAVSGDFISQISDIINKNDRAFIGGEVVDFPGGWNEFDIDGKHITIPYANGWLLACTRDCWYDLGGFDLRYGKFDYEDVDISTNALLKGYDIIALRSGFVSHRHQGSTVSTLGVDRLAHTKRNREIFIEKWMDYLPKLLH
jgi:GT2 family glycosyltransferase